MLFHRRHRCWLARCLIGVLLFMQFAGSAYACPRAGAGPAEAAADAAAMAAMPGCAGATTGAMDSDQPHLCKLHCEQGTQTLGSVALADTPSASMLVAVLDWSPAAVSAQPSASVRFCFPAGASPPGSPPRYLALLVLRI